MTRIHCFLGSQSPRYVPTVLAAARQLADLGQRTLLVLAAPACRFEAQLGRSLTGEPQTLAPNLQGLRLESLREFERICSRLEGLVRPHLPAPLLDKVFPAELPLLPGFDGLLTLNRLREAYTSGDYDAVIYAGAGDLETLRLLGATEASDWYYSRLLQELDLLDLNRLLTDLSGPLGAVLVGGTVDVAGLRRALDQVRGWLDETLVVSRGGALTTLLVGDDGPGGVETLAWLYGNALQMQAAVTAALVPVAAITPAVEQLTPLPCFPLHGTDVETCLADLHRLDRWDRLPAAHVPQDIDRAQRQVRVFLPGFTREQVKLSLFRQQLTIEAGEQRRKIPVPAAFQGLQITAGRFEAPYLTIQFG